MTPREIWGFLHPFHRRTAMVAALSLVDTALASLGVGIVLPLLQSVLDPTHRSGVISRVFPPFDRFSPDQRLLAIALGTVVVFVAKAYISFANLQASNGLIQKLRFYWVDRIGAYYLYGPFQRVAARKQGELLNDWFNETLSGTRFYQAYLTYGSSLALVVALMALGFAVDWRAMLAFLVLTAAAAFLINRTLYLSSTTLSKTKLHLNQSVSANMVEDLANIRDLKLMGAVDRRMQQLFELTDRLGSVLVRGAVIGEMPRIAAEAIAVTLMMGMVIVGALVLRLSAETLLPAIVFFSVAAYRLVSAASQAVGARVKALNEVHSVRRIRDMVNRADEREALGRGEPLERITTDIVFRGVGYGYGSGQRAVEGVDAVIPHGSITFLVGPSGAGKSTLLDLLLRLIDPVEGEIEANGRRADAFRLSDWRRTFGYVSQDVSLFNGSLRMNLLLARPQASDAEMLEACRLAGADTFLNALPAGLDTVVGDRGHSLSGGERKRIAIARALIGRPSVLILDEATTSFEQSLEQEILRTLRTALPGLTIVQVTHRLQSMTSADWVIVLERGHVIRSGQWSGGEQAFREAAGVTWARPQ